MPTTSWQFLLNGSTDFTSSVLSANIRQGREKYLDNYSGGSLVLTLNNSSGLASTFSFNDKVYAASETSGTGYRDVFTVQEITFNDYPGNTGLSTATIVCSDPLARTGRYQATNVSLTQAATTAQMEQFNIVVLPSDLTVTDVLSSVGDSIASAQTYTGTVLNQLNILQATERGIIRSKAYGSFTGQFIFPYARNDIDDNVVTAFTFGRNTSTTVIAYQDFERIQNGTSFINTATIQPEGLAAQTRSNSGSITSYGATFYSSSTADYTTTQAQANGDWIVNTFSDPVSLRFKIGFTDRAQNSTAYASFLTTFPSIAFSLLYEVPGSTEDITVQVVLEGWTINATPEQTTYELYFSPLNYYQFFILNSASLGTLGGGDIAYNQAEITYDDAGWIYNDSNADDTAGRLGW
jgi:hypothetical protein